MEEAERLCDRVGIMDHGTMIALGSPRELIASLGGSEVVELSATGPRPLSVDALGRLAGVRAARSQGDGYALTVDQVHVTVPELLVYLSAEGAKLSRLSTHNATLEDVFVHLTGRQLRE